MQVGTTPKEKARWQLQEAQPRPNVNCTRCTQTMMLLFHRLQNGIYYTSGDGLLPRKSSRFFSQDGVDQKGAKPRRETPSTRAVGGSSTPLIFIKSVRKKVLALPSYYVAGKVSSLRLRKRDFFLPPRFHKSLDWRTKLNGPTKEMHFPFHMKTITPILKGNGKKGNWSLPGDLNEVEITANLNPLLPQTSNSFFLRLLSRLHLWIKTPSSFSLPTISFFLRWAR